MILSRNSKVFLFVRCLLFLMFVRKTVSSFASKKNVLFLVSDDMRPELGAFKGRDFPVSIHPEMYTPNIDKLASNSLLLKRAYVQMSVCSPSRTSLLTGRRPDTTRVHNLTHYWRKVAGNFTTIPQYFKQNGYITMGLGKIFHPGAPSGHNDPISWSEPYYSPDNSHWAAYEHVTWHAADDEEERKFPLGDTQTALKAVKTLRSLSKSRADKPFFLAVGFHKPHLPFLFPARFMDYYPKDKIRLPGNPYAPVNMPQVAWSDFDELREYTDITTRYGYGSINTSLPDSKVLELRRAYYAAISYVDELVGVVLRELAALGLDNSTIVSFWGDHGWQLGEHGEWCKHTNFELSTHAPMMIRLPGLTDSGIVTEQLTEFVDLFPTLAEAAGLDPVPLCPEESGNMTVCTEGTSLLPLIRNPARPWKSAVFSQYPRMLVDGDIVMGYRLRNSRYAYTEWLYYDDVSSKPLSFTPRDVELYDHDIDPEENYNRANDAKYAPVVKKLREELRAGWRAALPKKKTNIIMNQTPL